MKKTLSLLTLAFLGSVAVYASPLTPEAALQRLNDSGEAVNLSIAGTRAQAKPDVRFTMKAQDGNPVVYVFGEEERPGFMVVSADDSTVPLLGYSDSGIFDAANIPPALQYWLDEYQRQIEYSRENGVSTRGEETRAGVTLPSSWQPIAPLVKTKWDQDAPYNNLCPTTSKGDATFTGCVATSVAQAMKYFNYPAQGKNTAQISFNNKTLTLNIGDIKFDWNNMLNVYAGGNYNDTQATAVATLMEAVGYAVMMNYGTDESGAVSGIIPWALINYFDYDKSIKYLERSQFTYTDWATMIYNNLKNVGPVVYDGTGSEGGHSWICDGYNGNGYFHMNWGWGGLSDGYFLLDALSPAALGAGGGAGGFIYDQGGLFDMMPNKGGNPQLQSQIIQYGSLTGSVNTDKELTLDLISTSDITCWAYQGAEEKITFTMGMAVEKVGDSSFGTKYVQSANQYNVNYSLTPYYIMPTSGTTTSGQKVSLCPKIRLSSLGLSDGKYKVTLCYKTDNTDWTPVTCDVGSFNYVYFDRSGINYTMDVPQPLTFSGTNAEVTSDLFYNSAVQVKATFSNTNGTELSRSMAFALVSKTNKVSFIGEDFLITVPSNGSVNVEWATSLVKQSSQAAISKATDFYPALYDAFLKKIVYQSDKTVTMQPSAGAVTAKTSVEIADAESITSGGNLLFNVKNAYDFTINSSIEITSGYMAEELYLGLYPYTGGTQVYLTDTYLLGEGYTFLKEGESANWATHLSLPSAKVGDIYFMDIVHLVNSGTTYAYRPFKSTLDTAFQVTGNTPNGDAGVESLFGSEGDIFFMYDKMSHSLTVVGGENGISNVEVYFVNGMKAPVSVEYNGESAFVSLDNLGKGIVIVNATDRKGNHSSTKLAL